MNKFLKRISLVGLLFSTSCSYSQDGLTNWGNTEFVASVGLSEGARSALNADQSCSGNVTVGTLPEGYTLNDAGDQVSDGETKIILERDSDYVWTPSNDINYLSPAKFNFNGKTVTLNHNNHMLNHDNCTFRVTQFGEVSCPSGSQLKLTDSDNVLLLEPGSKVGKGSENPEESAVESLSVDNGTVDLSKYFKDKDALAQGQKLYLNFTDSGTTRIKLFESVKDLNALKATMNSYSSEDIVFKNIALSSFMSFPSFTQITVEDQKLDFGTIKKLFGCDNGFNEYITKLFREDVNNGKTEIDVITLKNEEGRIIIPWEIFTTVSNNESLKLVNSEEKPVTLNCKGLTEYDRIDLSNLVDGNSDAKITLTNIPNSATINVGTAKNVTLELNELAPGVSPTIAKLIVPSNSTISMFGSGTIEDSEISSDAKVLFMPGSNINLGKKQQQQTETTPSGEGEGAGEGAGAEE